MRDKVESLVKKLLKTSPRYGEEIMAIAQSLPKEYLEIDIEKMESLIDPDKVSEDIEVPEIKI